MVSVFSVSVVRYYSFFIGITPNLICNNLNVSNKTWDVKKSLLVVGNYFFNILKSWNLYLKHILAKPILINEHLRRNMASFEQS